MSWNIQHRARFCSRSRTYTTLFRLVHFFNSIHILPYVHISMREARSSRICQMRYVPWCWWPHLVVSSICYLHTLCSEQCTGILGSRSHLILSQGLLMLL